MRKTSICEYPQTVYGIYTITLTFVSLILLFSSSSFSFHSFSGVLQWICLAQFVMAAFSDLAHRIVSAVLFSIVAISSWTRTPAALILVQSNNSVSL